MGFDSEQARGLLRVSLGRFNTQQEVDRFLAILARVVGGLNGRVPHSRRSGSVKATQEALV
jgi:cysteine sulfinate desulfinase/cysteine desulfurase-like protein